MLRSLFVLLSVGLVGMAVASLVFSLLAPLAALLIKIALVLILGYLILRMIKPDMAENIRRKATGEDS